MTRLLLSLLIPAAFCALVSTNTVLAGPIPEDCRLEVGGEEVSGILDRVRPGSEIKLECPNLRIDQGALGTLSTDILPDDTLSFLWTTRRHGTEIESERREQSFSLKAGNYEVSVVGVVPSPVRIEGSESKDKPRDIDIIRLEIEGQGVVHPELATKAISDIYLAAQDALVRLQGEVGDDSDANRALKPAMDRAQQELNDGNPSNALSLVETTKNLNDENSKLRSTIGTLEDRIDRAQQELDDGNPSNSSSLLEGVRNIHATNAELRSTVRTLEGQIEQAKEELDDANSSNASSLAEGIKNLHSANSELQSNNQSLQGQRTGLFFVLVVLIVVIVALSVVLFTRLAAWAREKLGL